MPWSLRTVIAVGPSGSDVSFDGGRSWKQFYDGSFDSVECAGHGKPGRLLGVGRQGCGRATGALTFKRATLASSGGCRRIFGRMGHA